MVRSGCRREAASHWNKKEKLHAALPRPRPWLWTVVMIATMFRGLPALCPASRPSATREPLHTFTLWWRLRGYRVPTPRPCHLAPHISLVSWTGIQEGRLWAFWLEIFKFDQMTSHITSTLIEIKPLRPEISWCPPSARAGRVAPLLPLFTSGLAWLGVTWPS